MIKIIEVDSPPRSGEFTAVWYSPENGIDCNLFCNRGGVDIRVYGKSGWRGLGEDESWPWNDADVCKIFITTGVEE